MYKSMSEITLPSMTSYANRIGADFHMIGNCHFTKGRFWREIMWEKFQLVKLFNIYETILYVDLDCYISQKCPDVFEIYKSEPLVVCNGSKIDDEQRLFYDYNGLSEPKIQVNAGVMLLGRSLRSFLKLPNKFPPPSSFPLAEQNWFAACFEASKIKPKWLDARFNSTEPNNYWIFHAVNHKNQEKISVLKRIKKLEEKWAQYN